MAKPQKMLIECVIQRKEGSRSVHGIGRDVRKYHFRPRPELNTKNAHVCEVSDPRDIKRFLSIDAYRIYGMDDDADFGGVAPPPAPSDDIPVVTEYVTDESDPEPDLEDEGEAEVDGEEESEEDGEMVAMRAYAKDELGIEDPTDKKELKDYAKKTFNLSVDLRQSEERILREIIAAANKAG